MFRILGFTMSCVLL